MYQSLKVSEYKYGNADNIVKLKSKQSTPERQKKNSISATSGLTTPPLNAADFDNRKRSLVYDQHGTQGILSVEDESENDFSSNLKPMLVDKIKNSQRLQQPFVDRVSVFSPIESERKVAMSKHSKDKNGSNTNKRFEDKGLNVDLADPNLKLDKTGYEKAA